jgi:FkbM family methyltransferase
LEPEHVVEYLGRPFAYPDGSLIGDYVGRANEWDTILRVIAATALPDEPVICEVGSNIGASILQIFAARPKARVVVIEPSDRFRRFLVRNLEAAGQKGTEVLDLALGEEAGELVLHNNASTASIESAAYDGHEARGRQRVEVATLDGLWAARDRMDLLKIDTDGHELAILKGASETLRRDQPLLFLELAPHLVGDAIGTVRLLQGAGYERFACLSPFPEVNLLGVSEDADEIVGWAQAQTHRYCDVVTWSPSAKYAQKMEPMLRGELR